MDYLTQKDKYWPKPKSRTIGFFSDSSVYAEVLQIGKKNEVFTKPDLKKSLVNNVKGLTFRNIISDTAIDNIIRELSHFGWIDFYFRDSHKAEENLNLFLSHTSANFYSITKQGIVAYDLFIKDKELFFENLIFKLNDLYAIPGWFVQRLWDIGPRTQGEIIIPAPIKNWNPINRDWNDNKWNKELETVVERTYNHINKIFPKGFTLDLKKWMHATESRWNSMALAKPRKTEYLNIHAYTPRKRLALAMKESSIDLLFSNINPATDKADFDDERPPLLPRSYSYWCARLEEIGLINYTDYNPVIPGRVLYPVCSFKSTAPDFNFREISDVRNLNKEKLYLFRPAWNDFKGLFLDTLYEEYKKIYLKVKALYISIQDLRDEVCRMLRLSSLLFDRFIELAVNESLYNKTAYRIALETDIREDQRKSLQRRPVYYSGKFVSLIAITNK